MIVRLNKEQIKQERRKLLGDVVYIIFHDVLKCLQQEGETALSPVELFLSAKAFAQIVIDLPDPLEGMTDEMEDLMEEADGENDAMIVMMLASGILQAVGANRPDFDARQLILRIYARWNDHKLFFRMLEEGAKKEESRWLEGKRTSLLAYELESIDREGDGEAAVRQLFDYFICSADKVDGDSIKGCLIVLNKYNNDHGNAYNREINALYEKLGIKSSTLLDQTFNFNAPVSENIAHVDTLNNK